MIIRRLADGENAPMELLLNADPSLEIVNAYLQKGTTVIAVDDKGKHAGVYVLVETTPKTVEIMNISVAEERQGQGIGRRLIHHAISHARERGYEILRIGTGNSSIGQLALYQKCGFRIVGIDFDFYIRHYPEPIFENGIQCRDMMRLEIQLQEDGE